MKMRHPKKKIILKEPNMKDQTPLRKERAQLDMVEVVDITLELRLDS